MSIRVLVNDHPHRALALATDTHVLLFKFTQTPSRESLKNVSSTSLPLSNTARKWDAPRCLAEFNEKAAVDLNGFRTISTAKGTPGLITLNNDVFICVITGSSEVATVRPGETVQRIYAVEFFCLNRSDYDHGGAFDANPYPGQVFSSDEQYQGGGIDQTDSTAEHPFQALKKLLSGGNFYYSLNFDLTRRLQDRIDASDTIDIGSLNQGLLWNSYMINPLLSFRKGLSSHEKTALDQSGMLTSVIRGFAQTLTIPPSSSPIRKEISNYPAALTIISRLSARRAGTRFNSRGVDDDGNVANFVETETIFWSPSGVCFSYVQIRGSIPIFWESSSSLIPGQQKVQITRSLEATQHSFDLHFEALEKTYGSVHIVNLLSAEKPSEVELSDRYREHIKRSSLKQQTGTAQDNHDQLQSTEFDFHERTKQAGGYNGAQEIRPYLNSSAESFVYFLTDEINEDATVNGQKRVVKKPVVIMQQNGVFRVNCLDCLDRTNLVQGIISQVALELFLSHRDESSTSAFWLRHSSLWADNGDALSKIYAGTGALKSSFTRHGKMSLGGLMADARKSATRLYVNHFEDKNRQNTVDLLLGRLVGQGEVELYDPVNDWVAAETGRRRDEYESLETIKVWVGTYNLNGKMMGDINQLRSWLPQPGDDSAGGYELVVVGFQEIVELSPQQIMSTDPGRRIFWENAVKECLNAKSAGEKHSRSDYVLLRSGQLVGAALMTFVKASSLTRIKNVEGAIKKTGMSGMAGNKGAVAIRMDLEGTSICFITAHLAAGFGNYDERNRDYSTISTGLRFQRDRSIEDHDYIMWAGDFNYRVGLNYDTARNLVSVAQKGISQGRNGEATTTVECEDALGHLYENDQLNIQMVAGHVFQFYHEGRVRFLPTYKFDLGKDDYDSSEKARIPAWTDRILWRVAPGAAGQVRQTTYRSVMGVRFSDHKPVFSSFEVDIRKIDEKAKSALVRRLYEKRQREFKDKSAGIINSDDDDGMTTGFESEDDTIEDIMGYQSIQEGLPPASSDRRKWWLDGEKPVRSAVGPPRDGLSLNPARNGNPWREDGEDDWVEIERPRESLPGNKPPPPPSRRTKRADTTESRSSEVYSAPKEESGVELRGIQKRGLPPPIPPTRNSNSGIRSFSGLTRTASIASTATTATMMTARSQNDHSDSSSTHKKTPPPKPSKPASLTTTTQTGSGGGRDLTSSLAIRPATPVTSVTRPNAEPQNLEGRPPPLPARTNALPSSSTTAGVSLASRQSTPEAGRPSLPPRGSRVTSQGLQNGESDSVEKRPARDLMDDDDDDGNSAGTNQTWKPLQPSR